jgi:ribokinase
VTVLVLGSANVDLVLRVDALPGAGRTILAAGVDRMPGGKGANQAVAAARAGAPTEFLGAVGADADGALLRDALTAAGVGLDLLRTDPGAATGLAVVLVAGSGENSIVVVPGANGGLGGLRAEELTRVRDADVVLAQLEIPVPTLVEAASVATGTVVLNAAPSRPLPDELWREVDLLVVNEHEAADLTGGSASATALLDRVPRVVVTLGAAGCRYADRTGVELTVPAPAARVVDTTAAGDTFCGVLAAGLARDRPIAEALRRASAAASIAVETAGAVPSIPAADAIEARYRDAYAGSRS